jgi:hypothetical protein
MATSSTPVLCIIVYSHIPTFFTWQKLHTTALLSDTNYSSKLWNLPCLSPSCPRIFVPPSSSLELASHAEMQWVPRAYPSWLGEAHLPRSSLHCLFYWKSNPTPLAIVHTMAIASIFHTMRWWALSLRRCTRSTMAYVKLFRQDTYSELRPRILVKGTKEALQLIWY